jgi:hypothetical protein
MRIFERRLNAFNRSSELINLSKHKVNMDCAGAQVTLVTIAEEQIGNVKNRHGDPHFLLRAEDEWLSDKKG